MIKNLKIGQILNSKKKYCRIKRIKIKCDFQKFTRENPLFNNFHSI